MYLIGMGAAILTGETDIAQIMVKAGLGVVGLLIIVFSTVTTTFLDAYYELDEEVFSDGLFRHVMVFRYKGGFDGDYDRWVETYNCLPPGYIRPGAEH